MSNIIHKNNESAEFDAGLNCILSDLTEDRYGDVVGDASHPMLGWDVADFQRNPIALFNHQSNFPIGTWKNLHVKDGALRGQLVMAPKGSSPRIDELNALLSAGVLKGISVGFVPGESKPRDNGGRHYLRQTLVESSLVSVPANPSALLTAKALGVSDQTIKIIFRESNAQRIREYRRSIQKMRDRVARETDPRTRASMTRALKALERAEREMSASIEQGMSDAERRRAARAMIEASEKREADRLVAEYNASWAGQAARFHDETIAAWTRAQQRLAPQDPPPRVAKDGEDKNFVIWRGQKIDLRLTWRGRRI